MAGFSELPYTGWIADMFPVLINVSKILWIFFTTYFHEMKRLIAFLVKVSQRQDFESIFLYRYSSAEFSDMLHGSFESVLDYS